MFLAFVCFAMNVVVHAADPDPLQDFCVADLSKNATHMNGYPCKARSTVTAADFLFTGLRGPGTIYLEYVRAASVICQPLAFISMSTKSRNHNACVIIVSCLEVL